MAWSKDYENLVVKTRNRMFEVLEGASYFFLYIRLLKIKKILGFRMLNLFHY